MSPLRLDHPTALVFMDETRDDLYFGVGAPKLRQPDEVFTQFGALRKEFGFNGKLRWADVGGYGEQYREFAASAALMVARHPGAEFACTLLDLEAIGGIKSYGSIPKAYVRLASETLSDVTEEPEELVSVLIDHFDAPASVEIERPIKLCTNRSLDRLAVVSGQRVTSAGTDGLQLADLILGGVTHEFRVARRDTSDSGKKELSLRLLTEGYGLTAYHDAQGGRSLPQRLTVSLLPRKNRRGGRGGRRP